MTPNVNCLPVFASLVTCEIHNAPRVARNGAGSPAIRDTKSIETAILYSTTNVPVPAVIKLFSSPSSNILLLLKYLLKHVFLWLASGDKFNLITSQLKFQIWCYHDHLTITS